MRSSTMLSVCGCALSLLLTSCGGGGGGSSSSTPTATPPVLGLSSVTVTGTTDVACMVSVNGIDDDDAVVDTDFSVELLMDDTDIEAFEAGSSYWGTFTISATDADLITTEAIFDLELED